MEWITHRFEVTRLKDLTRRQENNRLAFLETEQFLVVRSKLVSLHSTVRGPDNAIPFHFQTSSRKSANKWVYSLSVIFVGEPLSIYKESLLFPIFVLPYNFAFLRNPKREPLVRLEPHPKKVCSTESHLKGIETTYVQMNNTDKSRREENVGFSTGGELRGWRNWHY
ncbi:hypothetical protein T265_11752 [Opisthorchis viverrini]|uniref:Uncharacterized protein n=1 Tax=Opisthorchis viverrini TaxID=6198 RepID=A0A074Z1W8_OPIVI|nr:hypothetical protein T265_11752 [Opisthorchis viverrini]KER19492.1 hypothetical protein T265_11752 [Opisthorchis viverrini]